MRLILSRTIKHIEINFTKYVKDLYIENHKMWLNEIEENAS